MDFDRPERMEQRSWPAFIRGLVDVIVLVGGARAAVVQKVTRTIPIVTVTSGDLGLTIPQAILLPADQVIED